MNYADLASYSHNIVNISTVQVNTTHYLVYV